MTNHHCMVPKSYLLTCLQKDLSRSMLKVVTFPSFMGNNWHEHIKLYNPLPILELSYRVKRLFPSKVFHSGLFNILSKTRGGKPHKIIGITEFCMVLLMVPRALCTQINWSIIKKTSCANGVSLYILKFVKIAKYHQPFAQNSWSLTYRRSNHWYCYIS